MQSTEIESSGDKNLLTSDDLKLHALARASADYEYKLLREAKSQNALRSLSDDELHSSTRTSVAIEREATLNVLRHLSEIERRRLYSQFSCDSLFAYCVSELKMSEPHAARRVNASRLIRELPELENKMASGALSLTAVSQAHSFFKKEAKSGHAFNTVQKLDVIAQLESQPTRKADQILLSHASGLALHFKETAKPVTDEMTEIRLTIDAKLFADLTRLKEIWSNAIPDATYAELLRRMCDIALEKCDPEKIANRSTSRNKLKEEVVANRDVENQCSGSQHGEAVRYVQSEAQDQTTPAPESAPPEKFKVRSRYIPSTVRHAVWIRDGGRCTFVDDRTGRSCDSKHQVELDHVVAFSAGGENSVENLRLRCRTHNHAHAVDTFGDEFMRRYRRH